MSAGFVGYDEYGRPIYRDVPEIPDDVETVGLHPETAVLALVPETWNGHTKLCVHCGTPIKPMTTASGNWVHEGGRLNCLSSSIAITFAEPTKWTDAE